MELIQISSNNIVCREVDGSCFCHCKNMFELIKLVLDIEHVCWPNKSSSIELCKRSVMALFISQIGFWLSYVEPQRHCMTSRWHTICGKPQIIVDPIFMLKINTNGKLFSCNLQILVKTTRKTTTTKLVIKTY